jgi:hypothetical protein
VNGVSADFEGDPSGMTTTGFRSKVEMKRRNSMVTASLLLVVVAADS